MAFAQDVVIHATDIPASHVHGSWTLQPDATAADGFALATPDNGWASTGAPLASPADYVDVEFAAFAGVRYTLWLRLKALANSKWNDSVWVQYSDARIGGFSTYDMNSTSGLLVNLATDSGAASLNGWGWANSAYWLTQHTTVTFAGGGVHKLRIQVREDGVRFDQIVLSSSTYLDRAPGPPTNDTTILTKRSPKYVLSDFGSFAPLPTTGGPQLTAAGATVLVFPPFLPGDRPQYWFAGPERKILIPSLGGSFILPRAINDAGMVVGASDLADGTRRAFVWTATGGSVDLAPAQPGRMEAWSVNRHGDVVGDLLDASAAFLYTSGAVRNLNTVEIANKQFWNLESARLINDAGVIFGIGTFTGDRQPQRLSFLLMPVN